MFLLNMYNIQNLRFYVLDMCAIPNRKYRYTIHIFIWCPKTPLNAYQLYVAFIKFGTNPVYLFNSY